MKYEQVWEAVDKLAKINGLSPSGLAKKAGLDATTFNKSKRTRPDGKKRWPSLDSLNKIIEVCNISFDEFFALAGNENEDKIVHSIPYIECSRLLEGEKTICIDFRKNKWQRIRFPDGHDNLYVVGKIGLGVNPVSTGAGPGKRRTKAPRELRDAGADLRRLAQSLTRRPCRDDKPAASLLQMCTLFL